MNRPLSLRVQPMQVAETKKLRIAATNRKEWRETAENLRILGSTCLEIAEQMEKNLAETKVQHARPKARQAG